MPERLDACPAPAERRIQLRVTAAAEGMLRHGHPWLYDQAIREQSHTGRPGDLAVVFDRHRKFLAIGLYDPDSPLRLRVLQARKPAPIDAAWFQARLTAAAARRAPLAEMRTTGYRLVHGENDGLPGLVVDRYDTTLVVKLYTAAWVPHLREVLAALERVQPAQRVVLRLARSLKERPARLHGLRDGMVLAGPPLEGPVEFLEHGLRFEVDPRAGQKTGFFLDQRDNRFRVERLARGRRVLDAFAYTGAFSVYAARGGAVSVVSVDTSAPALEAAKRNMALNREHPNVAAAEHRTIRGDAFAVLKSLAAQRKEFDVVLLDPPAFAASKDQVREALKAYTRLTQAGLRVLRPGGVLVESSCSTHVGENAFYQAVHRAARQAKRPLREIERAGHPIDHPIGFSEGAYLRCLFARG
jgi:23S rRNA (cytosine1962-C5)-methyltransferase